MPNTFLSLVKDRAKEIKDEIVAIRRHIHQNPELSTQEFETQKFVIEKLASFGIENHKIMAKTGLVADIYGKNPSSRCVALRADMDALPICEANNIDYKSQNQGVMHACGHDAHTAILLAAAKILKENSTEWDGCVRLIFQPSEEDFRSGAPNMIEEGCLEKPKVERIYALHVLPGLKTGSIGYKSGAYMASTDEFYLKVLGKGGHAATPELNVDSVMLSANILTALQQVVSRQAPPYIPSVLSFGKIIGEGRTNIIPPEVNIEGTLRTFDENWRKQAHQNIETIAKHTAAAFGGDCQVKIEHGYPFVFNHSETTDKVASLAKELFGEDFLCQLPLRMTAEDFAYYGEKIPACLFRLGTGESAEFSHNLHTAIFNLDEDALVNGVAIMAALGAEG